MQLDRIVSARRRQHRDYWQQLQCIAGLWNNICQEPRLKIMAGLLGMNRAKIMKAEYRS
jgi:hypothetical protein